MAFISRQLLHRSLSLSTSLRFVNVAINNGHHQIVNQWSWRSSTGQIRCQSTKPIYDYSSLDSGDQKILKARELFRIKKLPRYLLRQSSAYLYEACTDKVDIERFMNELNLADTLTTWMCVTRIHVWMVLVRIMKEGKPNGEILRNEVVARMWEDCNARIDKLGLVKASHKKETLKTYYHEFNATLLSLDEGLLTDDVTLAGALWRQLFGLNSDLNPHQLELMVAYVRAQLEHLHRNVRTDQLLFHGQISWKPFPPLMM